MTISHEGEWDSMKFLQMKNHISKFFSFSSFSSEAYKDGNIGAKILLVKFRLGHSLNIVLYFKIDYREYCVYMCV